jgi:hypothetical protein
MRFAPRTATSCFDAGRSSALGSVILPKPRGRLARVRLRSSIYSGLFGASWIAAACVSAAGCGADKGACTSIGCASQETSNAQGAQGGSGGSGSDSALPGGDLLGGESSAGAGPLQDNLVCQGVSVSAPTSPVNVLILLDRSTSMLDPVDRNVPGSPSRWQAVTSAIRSFVNSAQAADARVGLQFFGLTAPPDDCGVDKYANPAVAVAPLGSNRQALLDAIDTTLPGSFTPTAPALEGVLRYSLGVAKRPENAGIPTVVIMASDGIPTECGPVGDDGVMIISFAQIIDILKSYSQPPTDAAGMPTQPPIRTYIVGTQALSSNANALAQAGDGQAFLVGDQAGAPIDLEAKFLDALLRIVVKPLSCELELPQSAPGTGQAIDFDKVRVRFTAANSRTVTEYPRTDGLVTCGSNSAWYYDDPRAPKKIVFCHNACQALGAGDLKVELGCAPQRILR